MSNTLPTSALVASTTLAQTPAPSQAPTPTTYVTGSGNFEATKPFTQEGTERPSESPDKGVAGFGGKVGIGMQSDPKRRLLFQGETTYSYQNLTERNLKNGGNDLFGTQGLVQGNLDFRLAAPITLFGNDDWKFRLGPQIHFSPTLLQEALDSGVEKGGLIANPQAYSGIDIGVTSGAAQLENPWFRLGGGARILFDLPTDWLNIVADGNLDFVHGYAITDQQSIPYPVTTMSYGGTLGLQGTWGAKLESTRYPSVSTPLYLPEYRHIKLLPTAELNYSHIFFPDALAMIYSDDSIADYETNIPYGNSNSIGGGYGLVLGDRTLELSALIHGGIVGYRSENSSGLRGLQVDGTLRLGGSPLSWLWIGADSQYIKTLGLTLIKHDTESEVYGGLPVAGAGNEDVWLKGANQIVLNPRVALRIPNSNMQVAAQYSLASLGNNGNGMVWHWTDDNTGDRLQAASHPHSLTLSLAWAPRNISTDINNIRVNQTQLPVSYHYKIKNNEANRQFLDSLEEVDQQTPENNTFGYEDQGDSLYITVKTGVDKTFDQEFVKKYADHWFTFKNSDGSPTYFFRETNELYGLDTTHIYADLRSQNLDGLADAFESAKKFIQTPEAEPIIDNSQPTQSPSTTSPLSDWDEIQNELSTQIANNLANLPEPQNEQTDEITKEELETLKKEDAEATAKALPRLLEGLKSRDSQIRLNIILLLYNIQPLTEEVKQALITALDDPDQHVRTHAALILGQSKEKAAVPALMDALNDPDPNVRLYASYSLGCIGPDANDAISALTHVSKSDPDESVRSTAEDALKKIKQAQ